jgi:hypothetical protein
MNTTSTRLIIACLWIATVGGAYWVGSKHKGSASAAATTEAKTDRSIAADATTPGGDLVSTTKQGAQGDRPTVKNIILQARAAMGSGMSGFMNMRGMLRALAPLAELNDAEIQEAIADIEATVKEPQQMMMFYSMLLSQWAETDGPAALAYAKEKTAGQGPMMASVTMSVIGSWAQRDPEAVWRWYLDAREKGERGPMGGGAEGYLGGIFSGMAKANLDAAIGRLSSLSEFERPQAVQGIAMTAMDPRMRESLLAKASSLDTSTRASLYQGIIGTWMMTDSEGATKWLGTLSEGERKPLVAAAGGTLMFMNPEKGAELQVQNATEKELPQTYSRVVSMWANRDPQGAGEWLNRQPQGPQLDDARRSFAVSIAARDAAGAFDWAKAMQDETKRVETYEQIYRTLNAKNPANAESALNQAGLPPEVAAKIRERAAPKPEATSQQ